MTVILILTIFFAIPPFVSLTNILPYKLNQKQMVVVFSYIFFCTLVLPQVVQSHYIYITLIGSWCLISFFQRHFILNISASILGYMFSVCINYLLLIPLNLGGLSYSYIESNTLLQISFCIAYSIVIYIFTCFLRKGILYLYINKLNSKFFKSISPKIWTLLFAELLACLMIFIFNLTHGSLTGYPKETIYFNGILLISLFIITIIIMVLMLHTLVNENSLSNRLQKFESLQEYTQKIEHLYSEMRTFKHDYINILSSMEIFLEEKEYDQLNIYFKEEILPTRNALTLSDSILGSLSRIEILEVKGALYEKLLSSINQSLNISVDIPKVISRFSLDTIDFIRIIGVFMDNAREAAAETTEKMLYIGLIQIEKETIIKISNSCKNTVSIYNLYQLGSSSKSESRGIGLYNAKRILNQYRNTILRTSCENSIFTQELYIYEEN